MDIFHETEYDYIKIVIIQLQINILSPLYSTQKGLSIHANKNTNGHIAGTLISYYHAVL